MPRPTDQASQPQVAWLPNLLNRLPERWRKPVLWSGVALALAAAGWLLPGGSDTPGAGSLIDTVGLVTGIVVKLGFVLLLAYGCLWLLRRWQGSVSRVPQRRLALLETLRFNQRQALHVVRAGDQVLLIGATDQALTVLAEVHDQPAAALLPAKKAPVVAAEPAFLSTGGFSQLLSRFSQPVTAQPVPQHVEVEIERGGHAR